MEKNDDNEEANLSIVKTEIEDPAYLQDENEEMEQPEYIDYGEYLAPPEHEGYEQPPYPEQMYFKQERTDNVEDMEYQEDESYQDENLNSEIDPRVAGTSLDASENWQYRIGFPLTEPSLGLSDLPGTSDMSNFAETREEKLYPCRHCDYVGTHPRLLSSHMNNRHIKSVVYQCPHCPYNSTIPKSTRDHMDSKHSNDDDKPMEIKRRCAFCEYSASNATALKNHMNKHTREKQHQCSYCEFNTLWEGYLKMHIRRKHSDQSMEMGIQVKEYPCQYCDYKASTPSTLKLHTNKHTREQEHQCPYCPYKTVWTTYIKLHIRNKHLKPEKSPTAKEHACNFCDYKAKNSTLLKQHLNKHTREKIHQCPHCPFTTLWMTYMKLHIKRKHTENNEGETSEKREFQCQYCPYKAVSSSHLKIHENKHTKAVEYKCEHCDFKTTWYGYLKLHTKRKHSVKEENPTVKTTYPCSFCPYKAINLSTLKVHQNKHTREVLYNCPHCDFKTTWRAYIKMHIEKHTTENFKSRKQKFEGGIRSYSCDSCDYTATQLGSLKLHINSKHTRKEMHKCPKCDYQCAVYGNLKMHIRRRHGLKPDPDGKYHCKQCEFVSETAADFRLHLNEKHDVKIDVEEIKNEDEKTYSCQYCSYQTLYPQVMKKHINKHTRQNVIKCPHCSYATVWNHYMKVHIRRHNEPKTGRKRFTRPNTDLNRLFPCQYCDHRSLSFSSLKDHINSVHTREVLHSCPYCEHKCTLKGNLKGHIRRRHPAEFVENEKKYPCGYCDFKTSVMRNLKVHMKKEHNIDDTKVKAENGEFQCQYCEYKARSYYALKIHNNKHTKESSYRCPECEFVTRWPNYLRKHIKQHSFNRCRVSCLYCDYKGCSTFRLRQHIQNQHKKDQYYPCPRANCEFKTIHYTSLRMHLKGSIHANTRTKSHSSVTRNFSYKYQPNEGRYFACDYCDYASKTQGNLDLHIKNKHDKRVIMKCSLCNYRTPSKSYLNRHYKVKHSVKVENSDLKPAVVSTQDELSENKAEGCMTSRPEKNEKKQKISVGNEEKSVGICRSTRKRTSIPSYVEEQTDEEDEILSEDDEETIKFPDIIEIKTEQITENFDECSDISQSLYSSQDATDISATRKQTHLLDVIPPKRRKNGEFEATRSNITSDIQSCLKNVPESQNIVVKTEIQDELNVENSMPENFLKSSSEIASHEIDDDQYRTENLKQNIKTENMDAETYDENACQIYQNEVNSVSSEYNKLRGRTITGNPGTQKNFENYWQMNQIAGCQTYQNEINISNNKEPQKNVENYWYMNQNAFAADKYESVPTCSESFDHHQGLFIEADCRIEELGEYSGKDSDHSSISKNLMNFPQQTETNKVGLESSEMVDISMLSACQYNFSHDNINIGPSSQLDAGEIIQNNEHIKDPVLQRKRELTKTEKTAVDFSVKENIERTKCSISSKTQILPDSDINSIGAEGGKTVCIEKPISLGSQMVKDGAKLNRKTARRKNISACINDLNKSKGLSILSEEEKFLHVDISKRKDDENIGENKLNNYTSDLVDNITSTTVCNTGDTKNRTSQITPLVDSASGNENESKENKLIDPMVSTVDSRESNENIIEPM